MKNWTSTRKVTYSRKDQLHMNEIAKTVFAPVYGVIARNALAVTGINRGLCLELGSGPAMLSIAVAREAPEMDILALDFSEDSREIAIDNIRDAHLSDRVRAIKGDVHVMPFNEDYADLIISRGSMFFWEDLKAAFKEICRVLSPGGATYIGGGFGSYELKKRVLWEMLKRNPKWNCYAKKKAGHEDIRRFQDMFQELGCSSYKIINDDTGFWIVIFKPNKRYETH